MLSRTVLAGDVVLAVVPTSATVVGVTAVPPTKVTVAGAPTVVTEKKTTLKSSSTPKKDHSAYIQQKEIMITYYKVDNNQSEIVLCVNILVVYIIIDKTLAWQKHVVLAGEQL